MEKVFDFKKVQANLYSPKPQPGLVTVPPMTFIAVDGVGNPNEVGGAYQAAVSLLYALAYAIKMSDKQGSAFAGYFPYVVPPLEGLWWMADGKPGVDYGNKSGFCWTSMIRQPDFVSDEVFAWACGQVQKKKHLDTTPAHLFHYDEGLCVQCMHYGPFDDEPATVARMDAFLSEHGLTVDMGGPRRHHEIYLTDPRKGGPAKMKTVIRHPAK